MTMENLEKKIEILELEKIAYTDALTGMGNRAAFIKELSRYEKKEDAGCVVADINNLKICNDRYGHQEGDRMIKEAAICIKEAFCEYGVCYRIGGDEFCVLIPKAEESRILAAIEEVEHRVEGKNEHRVMPLSIACGYAVREDTNETMEQLFNRSDAVMYDVKERMKQKFSVYREEKIKKYLDTLNIIGKTTNAYVYLWNIEADEFWYSDEIDKAYTLHDDGQVFHKSADLQKIVHPADWDMLQKDLAKISDGTKKNHNMDYRWINRWGEIVWINCRGTVINDDKGRPFVMLGRVSDEQLRPLYHPMTKLFNKEKLLQDFREELLEKSTGYLMLIGIDKLGDINLKYGRRYGDDVIKKCAESLENMESLYDIWHVEHNCFALYLDVETKEEVRKIYNRLAEEVQSICTLSAGVVPNKKEMFKEVHNLYDCAELTLEKAKNNGIGSIMFFSQEDLEEKKKEIQLLGEMQESVKNDCSGFYLFYQPQVKSGNYQLYGAEALLRYHSERRGEVYPDEFIPILEQSGLINQVGLWVLKTALLQCRQWRKLVEDFHISVNFSAEQLRDSYVAEMVLEVLKETGMPGNALTIELTESSQLQEIPYFDSVFSRWREAGIELSIDDFGTGYASMAYLKQLSVNEIKIDRMFVKGIEEATYNYRLISNMIEFAKSNGLRVCCEGVETLQELTVLEGLSPEMIQGYLFAKPCKKEEFEQAYIRTETPEHKKYTEFVRTIYQDKEKMNIVYFNPKDILRETEMGLWIIRINEENGNYEMHADETMEQVLALERKVSPKECYVHWYDRIREDYREYVQSNVKRMMESEKVVQLQYPWIHPKFGEVMIRCSGKRVKDSDGMITLKGYHRIISNIEER